MWRAAYRVGLLLVGLYLYSKGNSLWVFLALLLGWSFLQQQIAAIVGMLGKIANVAHEHDSNSVLIYTFFLEAIFRHPTIDGVFYRLQKNGAAPTASLDEWRQLLLGS